MFLAVAVRTHTAMRREYFSSLWESLLSVAGVRYHDVACLVSSL